MRRILFLALILAAAFDGLAQNCAQTLRLARSTYDQGRLHELPALMKDCLDPKKTDGFTKQEKVEAYKLLTMSYIYLEEPEKADSSMLLLLRTDPYFEPNPNVDPQEFLGLYKTFRTNPIFRLGIKLGGSLSAPNIASSNDVSIGKTTLTPGLGFSAGAAFELPMINKLTLSADLVYSIQTFGGSTKIDFNPNGEFKTIIDQNYNYLSFPIRIQYNVLPKSKFNPFVSAGISTDYLLASKLTLEQTRSGSQGIAPQDFDLTSLHKRLNLSAMLGAGIKRRIASGYLVAEVQFRYGLTKITSPENSFTNDVQIFSYKYAEPIYTLNSFVLTVGYVQNFFHPKKLARKKVSSIRKSKK